MRPEASMLLGFIILIIRAGCPVSIWLIMWRSCCLRVAGWRLPLDFCGVTFLSIMLSFLHLSTVSSIFSALVCLFAICWSFCPFNCCIYRSGNAGEVVGFMDISALPYIHVRYALSMHAWSSFCPAGFCRFLPTCKGLQIDAWLWQVGSFACTHATTRHWACMIHTWACHDFMTYMSGILAITCNSMRWASANVINVIVQLGSGLPHQLAHLLACTVSVCNHVFNIWRCGMRLLSMPVPVPCLGALFQACDIHTGCGW